MSRTRHDLDLLHQELAALHEFGTLHSRDMSGDLDQRAHYAWRVHMTRFTTRLDQFRW
jgi:hypothetical protein